MSERASPEVSAGTSVSSPRERARTNELVEFLFVAGESGACMGDIRGAYCFVRFLRVLVLSFIDAWLRVLFAVFFLYVAHNLRMRNARQVCGVGTHVGDVSLLVEFLCGAHGA